MRGEYIVFQPHIHQEERDFYNDVHANSVREDSGCLKVFCVLSILLIIPAGYFIGLI